ncbi:Photosynthetic NDH subunit of subcomplex B 3, chloroplastic [Linum perenne]
MGSLQFSSSYCYSCYGSIPPLSSSSSSYPCCNNITTSSHQSLFHRTSFSARPRRNNIRFNHSCSFSNSNRAAAAASGTRTRLAVVANTDQQESTPEQDDDDDEPPTVTIAFVHSVLLPDGTPDLHTRIASGGQKLRDIMLDTNIDLYGPYDKPLSNCAGGGTCATCMVEVIQGKQLLNPRTDKENDKLKRKPKNWRLACQTTVGTPDSTGLVVIQQLPEWKAHEWGSDKTLPSQFQIQQ